MRLLVPDRLVASCRTSVERSLWLDRLPSLVRDLERRWSLLLDAPFDGSDGSCAWVAPAKRLDGGFAVLKLGMPHIEGEHEIAGLRFWDGDPTVWLLEEDEEVGAMLLERCEPGLALRELPEPEQDVVIAGLLRRIWREPQSPSPFRPLEDMMAFWRYQTLNDVERWSDPGLVRHGLELLRELSRSAPAAMLLATDLHAGNVLRAAREPWLVIDPKPFVGDPAYDATQHLLNCIERLRTDPERTIGHFADLLGVDAQRVRLWLFARAAAEPRDSWEGDEWTALARTLAP
ncbi:MAG: aminoglycoside phosphotransferase family protein [Gemmatimonadaceae bacterium]